MRIEHITWEDPMPINKLWEIVNLLTKRMDLLSQIHSSSDEAETAKLKQELAELDKTLADARKQALAGEEP